jgi:hypothetical protein
VPKIKGEKLKLAVWTSPMIKHFYSVETAGCALNFKTYIIALGLRNPFICDDNLDLTISDLF